jgi:DNA-binding protein HU-beta
VNKNDIVEFVAERADVSKSSAARTVDAVIEAITGALVNGDSVTLVGFGTFVVTERPARVGRDPRTRKPINIDASRSARFRSGKVLKQAVAGASNSSTRRAKPQ